MISFINSSAGQKPKLSINKDVQSEEFRFSCEISKSKSVTASYICNLYTGENPEPYLKQTSIKSRSGTTACIFTATTSDVFNRLRSVTKCVVSCDYSLTSDPTPRSLMSDKYPLTRKLHFIT